MSQHIHSMLCLGDSYTIGEGVPLHESFPYQALQLLRKAGFHFHAPEIVAQTGWTTFELAEHLIHHQLEDHYDFVTLLIGVNNQYRGLSETDYKDDLAFLVRKAIHLVKNDASRVVVSSIPDWGVTPFAKAKNSDEIAKKIDAFNAINAELATQNGCRYVEITKAGRKAKGDASMLAADGLHPSGKVYAAWSQQLFEIIQKAIK